MNNKRAIVYLRWACEPSPPRRESERALLVRLAEEQGYRADVLEEVGQPADVYREAREQLSAGRAAALVVLDSTRLGRTQEALLEAAAAMRAEGWRVLTHRGEQNIDLATYFVEGYTRSATRSASARRASAARRASG